MLLMICSSPLWAQDKRFGVDNRSDANQSTDEDTSDRRYLPGEFNRRFGVRTEESEIEAPPPPPIQKQPTLVAKAAQQVARGNLKEAAAIYQQAISTKQQIDLAYFGLGNLLMKMGKFDQAANQFNQLITRAPNNAEAQLNLGVAYFCNGQIDKAIEHYQRAIDLRKGESASGYFNLALALYHQNELAKSIDSYQQAIKLRKNFAAAYNNLGLVYEAMGDYQMAATNYRAALAQKKDIYPLAHYNLARYYFNQGKFSPDAIDQLNLVLKQQSDFPEAYLILGNIYLLFEIKGISKSAIKAVDYYQKALKQRENYALAHQNLAVAYTKLGDMASALSEYRWAFQLSSKYSPFLLENIMASITKRDSFYINDEFSHIEGPGNFRSNKTANSTSLNRSISNSNQYQIQDEDSVIIKDMLDEYSELDNELKASSDIRYCFGKAYASIGNWSGAINEFAYAIKLSNGADKDASNMLQTIYQQIVY